MELYGGIRLWSCKRYFSVLTARCILATQNKSHLKNIYTVQCTLWNIFGIFGMQCQNKRLFDGNIKKTANSNTYFFQAELILGKICQSCWFSSTKPCIWAESCWSFTADSTLTGDNLIQPHIRTFLMRQAGQIMVFVHFMFCCWLFKTYVQQLFYVA